MVENITPVSRADTAPRYLEWSPIVLGALAATALSSVLLGFGATDWPRHLVDSADLARCVGGTGDTLWVCI